MKKETNMSHRRKWPGLVRVALFFILGQNALLAQLPIFPKGTNLTSLTVIADSDIGNSAQKIMISTLQGVVARRSGSQIYIDIPGLGYSTWKDHLRDGYGIPYSTQSNPWLLVLQFASLADGYILYNATNANSINAATSLCGPLNGVAVDSSIELTAKIFGLNNKLADVSARDEAWVWTNYNSSFSHSNVVEQAEWISDNLRDYAALANAFTFYDGNSAFRTNIMDAMAADAACFGWGDASLGEDKFVAPSSQRGVFTLASNWALNLSTLSSVRDPFVTQRTYGTPTTETNVHYVTFIATDGDNVEFDINGSVNYFNHPARGRFSMGYGLSPSLADLAPSVLRWYFENASNGPSRDFFVTGVSGAGYMYPSMYPVAELPLHLQKLNNLMARADLNLVQVLDFNSVGRMDLWNQYLAQPTMDALFYEEYSPYHGAHGVVSFGANGKPVIAARESLWADLEEETNIIANINAAVRDPSSALGYTMVCVHVWTKNLGNVQQVVTNLAPDVRVVTPAAFACLVRQNVGCRLAFDFSNGAQGWTPHKGGRIYDNAQWTGAEGGGALLLDGTDLGVPNTSRNSYFDRQIILPPNATSFTFQTRAVNDGKLRLRVVNSSNVSTTLLNYESLSTTNWVTRTVDISAFAGQVVTFVFEQNDGGQGANETRYVDDIVVLTTRPALYAPLTPRLLTPVATLTNGVKLTWRINDSLADQFKLERRLENGGTWTEFASVSGAVTNFADTAMIWGTNYLYRVRGVNTQGFSPYSNERNVTTPLRPALAASIQSGMITLSWPGWATNYTLYGTTNFGSWSSITNTPANQGGSNTFALPLANGARFFRLMSQ
jgi:hypothetical protein